MNNINLMNYIDVCPQESFLGPISSLSCHWFNSYYAGNKKIKIIYNNVFHFMELNALKCLSHDDKSYELWFSGSIYK
jgi:hypothetical protein